MSLLRAIPLLAIALAAGARAQGADPCLRCDVMYAVDCGIGLWEIDTVARTSRRIGTLPTVHYDLAATLDGRLVGATSGGQLLSISACDGSSTPLVGPTVGNGLGADLATTDLFAIGPPLVRVDSTGTGAYGSVGNGTGWCGASVGDAAMSPVDSLLRVTLDCGCFTGATTMMLVDPVTGDGIARLGCMQDASGATYEAVYGLAFDSRGDLWATYGFGRPEILKVDPDTGLVEVIPISGGYACGNGLACLPCGLPFDPCEVPPPPPPGIGPAALRVTDHGDPEAPDATAVVRWDLDAGAPRAPTIHFHVYRGTDPRVLSFVTDPEPLAGTSWQDSTPAAVTRPFVHFYVVRAADECEQESAD